MKSSPSHPLNLMLKLVRAITSLADGVANIPNLPQESVMELRKTSDAIEEFLDIAEESLDVADPVDVPDAGNFIDRLESLEARLL
jgi:hypothetical protein